MLLNEIFRVFVCLFLGNAVDAFHVLPVPGSVIGLVLLYIKLSWLGEAPQPLGQLADHMLGWLVSFAAFAGCQSASAADSTAPNTRKNLPR